MAAAAILKGMTAHRLIKSVYPVHGGDTVLLRVLREGRAFYVVLKPSDP